MIKEIYLDNAATTPCAPEVIKAMAPYWSKIYGNPSSFNDAGRQAKKAMEEARKKIARIFGARLQEIIFTSSATEANNLVIFGVTKANIPPSSRNINTKGHIITTKVEHHSVLEPIRQLEKEGYEVTYLPVSHEGIVNLNEFKKALRPSTILVSIIYASNEIGSIQPIKKIAKIIKEWKHQIKSLSFPYFHTDAAQACGYLDINVNNLGVDLMTVSSSKIHGPKGIAALYIRKETKIEPLLYGGGQEWGLRSSTQAVPLIVGFAKALELTEKKSEKNSRNLEKLRGVFVNGLKKLMPEVRINGPENQKDRLPHIINVTFPAIENEQLLLYLDKYGVRASAGSACASKEMKASHVLLAIGCSKEEARSSLRFSLSSQTKKADIDYVLKILPKIKSALEKIYPKELKKHYYA